MEMKDLKYFITAIEAGSLSAGANQLHITHQGLSSAIRRLESELGFSLFHRLSGGIRLTEQGHHFYDEVKPICNAFSRLQAKYTAGDDTSAIAITTAFGVLPQCPKELQNLLLRQNGDLKVTLNEHFFPICESQLEDGICSLSILYGNFDQNRFLGELLFYKHQCMILHREHPLATQNSIALSDLKNLPLIFPPATARAGNDLRIACQNAGFIPNVVFECERPMEILHLVKQHPDFAARVFFEDVSILHDKNTVLLPFSDFDASVPVYLLQSKKHPLNKKARQLKKMILDAVRHNQKNK